MNYIHNFTNNCIHQKTTEKKILKEITKTVDISPCQ